VTIEPALDAFAASYDRGAPQVVWTRLIDDLETPVSAYLKLAHGRPYACSRASRAAPGGGAIR
jgi:anthranilate synthase component 1